MATLKKNLLRILRLTGSIFLLAIAGWSIAQSIATSPQNLEKTALVLKIDGAIGPATQEYIQQGLHTAAIHSATLVILQINTPGGLDQSMRGIISAIIASPVPVISYVAPSGARAASAGTYIMYASHIAAMAPGTNLGAATPVSIGMPSEKPSVDQKPLPKTAEEKKALNDALAYIRSLAELRNRNVSWGEQAVSQGASLSANEALKIQVIDVIANDIPSLLQQIDGRKINLQGQERILQTQNLKIETLEPSWRSRFLAIITDPNVAYILLIIGMWGIFFEFVNPGLVLPGVVGAISLLLGLYALQLLPVNYAALGLILLGVIFLVAELFVASFGVLAVGGIIAFVLGSILLFQKDVPGYQIAKSIVITVAVLTSGFFLVILRMALKARKKPIVSGAESLIGSVVTVIVMPNQTPRVRIQGELWQIQSEAPLQAGQTVEVVAMKGLILVVKPVSKEVRLD